MIPDDDHKIVETSKINMASLFEFSVVLYFIEILSGFRNFKPDSPLKLRVTS